jgi:hypothetical protein
MSDTRVSLSFREVMSGAITFGTTDPEAGANSATATPLVMRGHVTIDDMDVFIDEPDHTAQLDVKFDLPSWGKNLNGSPGVFNLFTLSDDPRVKLMVYEWPAVYENSAYYFAGQKRVAHDSALDLWKDTTTLYVNLHAGADKTGPVIGAGIIRLTAPGLLHMIGTFEPIDPQSAVDRVRVIAEFGKFFLGELWDTYGPARPNE